MAASRVPGVEISEFVAIEDPDDSGSHDAWWGVARLHVKSEDLSTSPYMLANELVCSRLAASLGLPVLPGEIARGPNGQRCWVTPQVSSNGITPPPTDASTLVAANAAIAAGILVFDSWVRNEDRTADNILYDQRLGVWLIDHEAALAGADGAGFDSLDQGSDVALAWHVFRGSSLPGDAIVYWRDQVRGVHKEAIDRALEEASQRGLLNASQVKPLRRFLLARRDRIGHLLPEVHQTARYELPPPDESGQTLF